MHTHFHDVKWRVSLNAGMTCDLYKNQKESHALEFQLHHAARESKILNYIHPLASYFSPSNFLVHIQLVGACLPLHWGVHMMNLDLILLFILDLIQNIPYHHEQHRPLLY